MARLLKSLHNKRTSLEVERALSEELEQRCIVEERLRDQDVVLRMQSNGAWFHRRVVLSKDKLSFAFRDEDIELDYIPLSEVQYTIEMKETVTVYEEEQELQLQVIHIATNQDGYNSGRAYYLGTESQELFTTFFEHLKCNVKAEKNRAEAHSMYLKVQRKVRKAYNSDPFQGMVATLITANFIFTIIESEQVNNLINEDGSPTQLSKMLDWLNDIFTYVFTAELAVNAFAHWFRPFIKDPWNILDIIVVATSIMSLVVTSGSAGTVRIMRAFRVIRLFGRLKALKKIITALTMALVPVLNVFIILFLLLSIAAIVGVTLFREMSPDGFSMFSIAFFTLFHVTTGDSWPESMQQVHDDGSVNWLVEIYSTVYILVVVWVILQVSVAVLLDNFISASSSMDQQEMLELAMAKQKEQLLKNPMEPLLLKLAREFTDSKDLSEKLQKLYVALDTDRSGGLDSHEFCAAIKKLDFKPRIHMSDADFSSITKNGALCDENGHLGPREFEIVMREQIRHVAQSKLVLLSNIRSPEETDFMLHGTLKMLFMEQTRLQQAVDELLGHLNVGSTLSVRGISNGSFGKETGGLRLGAHAGHSRSGVDASFIRRTKSGRRATTGVCGGSLGQSAAPTPSAKVSELLAVDESETIAQSVVAGIDRRLGAFAKAVVDSLRPELTAIRDALNGKDGRSYGSSPGSISSVPPVPSAEINHIAGDACAVEATASSFFASDLSKVCIGDIDAHKGREMLQCQQQRQHRKTSIDVKRAGWSRRRRRSAVTAAVKVLRSASAEAVNSVPAGTYCHESDGNEDDSSTDCSESKVPACPHHNGVIPQEPMVLCRKNGCDLSCSSSINNGHASHQERIANWREVVASSSGSGRNESDMNQFQGISESAPGHIASGHVERATLVHGIHDTDGQGESGLAALACVDSTKSSNDVRWKGGLEAYQNQAALLLEDSCSRPLHDILPNIPAGGSVGYVDAIDVKLETGDGYDDDGGGKGSDGGGRGGERSGGEDCVEGACAGRKGSGDGLGRVSGNEQWVHTWA